MTKRSNNSEALTYNEYHSFLQETNKPKVLKNAAYYLKQYSFFKDLADAMPCAIYMLNYSTQEYLFVSESCKNIIGYSSEECLKMGQKEWAMRCMNKDDIKIYSDSVFSHFVESAKQLPKDEIKNCRFSINYRLKRKDGVTIKILQQSVILETNKKGYPVLVLGIITDITAHKSDDKMTFSISHYNPKIGFKTITSDSFFVEENKLTLREKEVIKHIVYGHNTSQIANVLFISPFTVRAHRRNILEKINCKNVAELVNYAINTGIA